MPPRSNGFQRLMLLIEAQLAPNDARIEESLMLKDIISGTLREIDIAIEIPGGPRNVLIAIECRDHRRPADVTWIEELMGKYIHLPVDRVVAVSRSGFTEAAKAKATVAKIEALTIEEAESTDWITSASAEPWMCVVSTWYKMTEVRLLNKTGPDDPNTVEERQPMLRVYRTGGPTIRLNEILHEQISRDPFKSFMTELWRDRPGTKIDMTLLLPGWFYQGPTGIENELAHALVSVEGGLDIVPLRLHPISYAGTTAVHGETTIGDESVTVVAVKREGEATRWSWYFRSGEELPWRISPGDLMPITKNDRSAPRRVFVGIAPPLPGALVWSVLTALQLPGIAPDVYGNVPAPKGEIVTNVFIEARNDLLASDYAVLLLASDGGDRVSDDWALSYVRQLTARGVELVCLLVRTEEVNWPAVGKSTLDELPISIRSLPENADVVDEIKRLVATRFALNG